MAAKETIRLNINNLVPDEQYVVQVRAVGGGEDSEWSQKLHFKTVDDKAGTGGPSIPQNVAWVGTAESVVLEWDPVGGGAGNTKIDKYEVEISGGAIVNQSAYQPTGATREAKSYSVSQVFSIFRTQIPDLVRGRVRTVNSAGTRSDWSGYADIAIGKPDPPTEAVPPPTAKSVIDAVALRWTPPVNMANVAGYRVYMSTSGPGFTPSGSNRIYEGAAPAAQLNSSTYVMHYFKIRAYSLFGKESDDLAAEAAPRSPFGVDKLPPPVPTNIVPNLVRDGESAKGTLAWDWVDDDDADVPLSNFSIRWRKTGTTLWDLTTAPATARAAQFDLASPFSDYQVQISSVDAVGNYSEYVPATPASIAAGVPGPPPQVTGVTATPSLSSLVMKWTASTALDVVYGGSYRVQVATNSGFTAGLIDYLTGDTQIVVSGLLPATTYHYRVAAIDTSGAQGAWSAAASVATTNFPTVKSDGQVPPQVGTVTVTPGIGYLSVAWPAVTNADAVTYEVHISETTGFTPSASTLVSQGNSTNQIVRITAARQPLVYGTTYYVKVIAKDVDGFGAASAQASGAPVRGTTFDIEELSIEKITGGEISGEEFVIAPLGSLRTDNSDVIITSTGIQVGPNSSISAAAMQAGTAFVDDLTVSSKFTLLGTNAYIQSSNYSNVGAGAGFQLHSGGMDIRSGTIAVGTLIGGMITAADITIGDGGTLTVAPNGFLKSSNYSATQGWRISNTGIEMNDSASSIKAGALKGGSFTGGEFIVANGGAMRSETYNSTQGWYLDYQGLTMRGGTISGATVATNQLHTLAMDQSDNLGGYRYGFTINSAGYAEFTGAYVYGNLIVSGNAAHRIQSNNWSSGSVGWAIRGDGEAELNTIRVGGGGKDYMLGVSNIPGDNRAYLRFINGSDGTIKGDLKSFNTGIELAARLGPSIQLDVGNATITGGLVVTGNYYSAGGVMTAHGGLRTNGDLTVGTNITAGHNLWAKYQTGGGPRYAVFYADGQLAAAGAYSSEKVKRNIEPLSVDPKQVLKLEPVEFHYNTQESDDEAKFNGFIAERAVELGLDRWVNFDEDGEPEAFDYPMYVSALQTVNRYQEVRIDELEARLAKLEQTLDK